ncbi:MAG: YceI family protein [Bacteroidota bacterium]|nr:YceI family protein [Bacteroidota bacterium]
MKSFLLGMVCSLLFFSGTAYKRVDVKTVRADKTKSYITYHMSHPLHNWDGTSKEVDAVIQYDAVSRHILKVAALAKVASFDSKNSNRDSHMLEVTDAIKFPSVSFVSSSIVYSGSSINVSGTLSFHGLNKNISFTANEQEQGSHKIVTGKFVLLLDDFKVERPSMMMMKTDNEMKFDFVMDFPMN